MLSAECEEVSCWCYVKNVHVLCFRDVYCSWHANQSAQGVDDADTGMMTPDLRLTPLPLHGSPLPEHAKSSLSDESESCQSHCIHPCNCLIVFPGVKLASVGFTSCVRSQAAISALFTLPIPVPLHGSISQHVLWAASQQTRLRTAGCIANWANLLKAATGCSS